MQFHQTSFWLQVFEAGISIVWTEQSVFIELIYMYPWFYADQLTHVITVEQSLEAEDRIQRKTDQYTGRKLEPLEPIKTLIVASSVTSGY